VISDKEMAANPPPKKEKLTPVGFRCNDEVYKYLQDKAVELSQEFLLDPRTGQYVIDPQTNQPKKILEQAKEEALLELVVNTKKNIK
jgi:hypothetical protein